jgi:putative endonuclease
LLLFLLLLLYLQSQAFDSQPRYAHLMHETFYYTYIVASKSRTLYIGMTGDLHKRIFQHKQKTYEGFSAKYNCNRLVWFERFLDVRNAIHREKELKGWLRARKVSLIESVNPTWEDLSEKWYPHLKTALSQTNILLA